MSARDVILISALFFTLIIAFLVTHMMYGKVADQLINTTQINASNQTIAAIEAGRTVSNRLDYVGFAIFIGLLLAMIISSWFLAGNQLFMFIYFIFLVIAVVISALLSYVWDQIADSATFVTIVPASFPITDHILTNFPIYMSIIGFIGLVVMFAKPYIAQDQY